MWRRVDIFAKMEMEFPTLAEGNTVVTVGDSCEFANTTSVDPKLYEKLYLFMSNFK